MKRIIVAVGHHKNVGKDTFVKFCIDVLRPQSKRLKIVRRGFADKIYEFCHSVYGWDGFRDRLHYINHPEDKNIMLPNVKKTPRQLLIEIGTPVMRAYDDNIWINANLRALDFDVLFVSDLRFPNEFKAVEALGGSLIRVVRPNLSKPTDVADCALDGWEDKWDMTVENDGDLRKLHTIAETFVRSKLASCLV